MFETDPGNTYVFYCIVECLEQCLKLYIAFSFKYHPPRKSNLVCRKTGSAERFNFHCKYLLGNCVMEQILVILM